MNLLLLMTPGMSLERWEKLGFLDRELRIYKDLADKLGCVYIFTYGKSDESYVEDLENVKVIQKLGFLPEHISFPKKLNRIIDVLNDIFSLVFRYQEFEKIDFVKTNQFSSSRLGLLLKTFYKKRLIVRMGFYYSHFKKVSSVRKFIEKHVFNKADGIIVTSKKAREYIAKTYNCEEKAVYIPNYIDTEIFKPLDVQKDIDILYVGRFDARKNPLLILEAAKSKDYRIVFIGSGPLEKEYVEFANKNSINLKIVPRIPNENLPKYYNRGRTFVLPSYYEGNPKVLLEAMACGTLCIGTNVPGISEVISDSTTGFLVDVSAAVLERKLNEVFADELPHISKAARDSIISMNNTSLEKEISLYL